AYCVVSYFILFATLCCSVLRLLCGFFFFSSRRRHTRFSRDWSSDVCSSDLAHFEWPAISPPSSFHNRQRPFRDRTGTGAARTRREGGRRWRAVALPNRDNPTGGTAHRAPPLLCHRQVCARRGHRSPVHLVADPSAPPARHRGGLAPSARTTQSWGRAPLLGLRQVQEV